jgi:hypothetical protein
MTAAPHFYRSTMSLGPTESICFKVSCDAQAQWENGIFLNSRYGIFFLLEEGGKLKLELTSKGLDTIKFRKCTVKSEEGAINRILKWMSDIMGESVFMEEVN